MRILGIDPGIGRTGWGIISVSGTAFTPVAYGCIETEANMPLPERLHTLYASLTAVLAEYTPEEAGIEELFFNTNAKTALVVGQARGVSLLTLTLRQIPVVSYTPLQVKTALTGYGRAEKNQVGQMVKTLLHLPAVPKPDDTADALAIALTHAYSRKMRATGQRQS